MGETIRRHGVLVTLSDVPERPLPPVSERELPHLLKHMQARSGRKRLDYRLEYKGYPGFVRMTPDKDDRWTFRLGYGFSYPIADMVPSPSSYGTLEAALDAAIKMFLEGRKLAKGKTQRDSSPMQVAQEQRENRRRRK